MNGILAEGELVDYSIEYDASRIENVSHWRGVFLLHPADSVIPSGKEIVFRFQWYFSEKRPDQELIPGQQLFVKANHYTVEVNTPLNVYFESAEQWGSAEIEVDGKLIPYEKNGLTATFSHSFSATGEREIRIRAGNYKTLIRINVIESANLILNKRVKFLVEKQQYNRSGSSLDGAFLIYDKETEKQFYDSSFFDSNAARERIGMGCVIALALQKKSDSLLKAALIKYRAFLEREIVCTDGTVYNDAGHGEMNRAYNYPWIADFYLEYGKALHEPSCFIFAAKVMLAYYKMIEPTGQESPCIEDFRIFKALEENGEVILADELRSAALHHANGILAKGDAMYSEEVSYTQVQFSMKIISLCQAWQFTEEQKYLDAIPLFLKKAFAFSAEQPDFHCFGQGVRYWDLYWFGKSKSYGDTMPQWLSGCHARMLILYGTIMRSSIKVKFA